MRVPTIIVTVDGQELTGPQAAVGLAQVDVGMGAAHDRARLAIGWQSPVADVAPGAELVVAIGYEEAALVLTGRVDLVSRRPWGLVVDVLAAPARLATTRVGRSYIEMSAGDIVRDLLAEAQVPEGEIDAGPIVAAFHVDEKRSAWRHIQELARTTGAEVSTAPDGALHFRPAPGAENGGLGGLADAAAGAAAALVGGGGGNRYGAELHDFAFGPATELAARPAVVAYGAGSELGTQKWHILVREPEGGAPDGPTLIPSILRDREGADRLAAAIGAAGDRSQLRGWIDITGNAELRAGDTIEVTGLPQAEDAGVRIRRLTHRVSRWSGFATSIDVEAAA